MGTYEGLISLIKVADGAQGPAADEYRVESNQEEILRFKDSTGIIFSPGKMDFYLTKENEKISSTVTELYILSANFNTEDLNILQDYSSFVSSSDGINHTLEISKISNLVLGEEDFQEDESKREYYSSLPTRLKTSNVNIKITLEAEGKKIYKIYLCRNGMSTEMLDFSVNATNINAAMGNAGLNFSADGLTITNTGFAIYKQSETDEGSDRIPLLRFDENSENLILTGRIEAESGYFKGELASTSGKIGGFNIEKDQLYKADFIYYEASEVTEQNYKDYYIKVEEEYQKPIEYDSEQTYYIQEENRTLVLNGKEGKIIADNIELGTGAVVKNYIALGEAKLYNPTNNEGKVLSAGDFSLLQDGHLNLGNIEMYSGDEDTGVAPYIKTDSWEISGDGQAIFKDIYADNVHLLNTIMEIGTVQNIGSLMIFKDAWVPINIIENNGKSCLEFEEETSIESEDWVYNGAKYFKVTKIEENGKKVWLNKTYDAEDIQKPVSKFGKAESKDFVFSAYGENGSKLENYKFASPYSITLADFNVINEYESNPLSFTKRLVLGQLDGIKVNNHTLTGIGLYCDNVYLNGSLTAEGPVQESKDSYYSGIHTSLDVPMPDFIDKAKTIPYFPGSYIEKEDGTKEYRTGNILLWAGAKGDSEDSIKSAPFRVDSLGNLYAGSGYFKGSIISEATITAATMEATRMRTAILEGWGKTDQPSLKIINTEKGIGFGDEIPVDGAPSQYNEIFSISKTGLKAGQVEFIKIDEGISNTISSNTGISREDFTVGFKNNKLQLQHTTINNGVSSDNFGFEISKDTKGENGDIKGAIKIIKNDKEIVLVEEETSIFNTNMYFNNNINYSTIMKYEKVEAGYDLYVN